MTHTDSSNRTDPFRARRLRLLASAASLAALTLATLAPTLTPAHADAAMSPEEAAAATDSVWPDLKSDLFGQAALKDGASVIGLDAPDRATDPALVPITLTLDPKAGIRKVTLVIDNNPSPVAATFEIAEGSGLTRLSTRVRVNAYTDIHAVAEAADGSFYVSKKFVKAAGGCAAPAGKDPEQAAKEMGQMKLREFAQAPDMAEGEHEAQLLIRHPNNSGLQKDQVTLLYIPAHFITDLKVDHAGRKLFTMTGGISISEDPSFRFTYAGDPTKPFHAKATDTSGNVFEKTFAEGQS